MTISELRGRKFLSHAVKWIVKGSDFKRIRLRVHALREICRRGCDALPGFETFDVDGIYLNAAGLGLSTLVQSSARTRARKRGQFWGLIKDASLSTHPPTPSLYAPPTN